MQSDAVRTWAMILHLSMLSGMVIPYGGFVIPIVIWVMKKDESDEIDRHGRNAVDWMISSFLYAVAAGVLFFTVIGIPAAIVLWILVGLCNIALPVIAALKANEGQVWRYPASLRLLG